MMSLKVSLLGHRAGQTRVENGSGRPKGLSSTRAVMSKPGLGIQVECKQQRGMVKASPATDAMGGTERSGEAFTL